MPKKPKADTPQKHPVRKAVAAQVALPEPAGEFEVMALPSYSSAPKIERPLPPKVQRFIECYVASRDVEQAAERAGLPAKLGIKLYKTPRIYREIHRRDQIVHQELAVQTATARLLTVELLDAELVETVRMPLLPGMAPSKVGALKLAYGRLGITVDPLDIPPKVPSATASMYSYLFQQRQQNAAGETVTKTVAVEGRAPIGELPAAPAPVIQGALRPRDRNEEILIEIDGELCD